MMKMTSSLSAAFSAYILMIQRIQRLIQKLEQLLLILKLEQLQLILKLEQLLLIPKLQQLLASHCSMMATIQLMSGRMWRQSLLVL